jgi:hypothetical protein
MGSILLKRSFFVIDTDCLSFFGDNIYTVNLGYSEPQGTDKIGSLYPKFAINDNNKINTYKNFYNAFIV